MPSAPRSEIFDPAEVGIYHCYNRVVQRAFLCGFDLFTQTDFNYRKDWVRQGLQDLAGYMAVEVLDYAVLDNHLHTILRNRPDLVEKMSDEEVARRWWHVCPGTGSLRNGLPAERTLRPGEPTAAELDVLMACPDKLLVYRQRLSSISWWMRLLCQPIARRANREAGVSGRFFADRFKCKRIEDEAGLLACSIYVNLNPIRAGLADSPEHAGFTAAFDRIRALLGRRQRGEEPLGELTPAATDPDAWLAPVWLDSRASAYGSATIAEPIAEPIGALSGAEQGAALSTELVVEPLATELSSSLGSAGPSANPLPSPRLSNKGFLPITIEQYLELLDWTGRQLRQPPESRGSIPQHLAPILTRLSVRPENWVDTIEHYPQYFTTSVGRWAALQQRALQRGRKWLHGLRQCAAAFL